jgi:hypothetical protein
MVNVIIIAVVSAAGLLMMNDNEPPAPPVAVPVEAQPSFEPLANAMFWVGGCSVACSLIWGSAIVFTARLKREANR